MSKEIIKSTQFQTFDPNILSANEFIGLEDQTAQDQLKKLYEGNSNSFVANAIVKGTILEKNNDGYMLDIGYKSQGFVPFAEFNSAELEKLAVGDSIEVMIEELENKNGIITLSYEKAKATRSWERIALLYKENKPVEGIVTNKVQGGLCVDIGITVFLPGSQIDTQRVVDFDAWVGKKIQAYIIKLMPKRGNVVISRRKFMYEQKSEARKEIMDTFAEGQVVQGVVKNITKYGAFVDIGGVDGLLHITDMTWSRIEDQTELINIGDNITVKILSFDKENEKISLGMKQLSENPWDKLSEDLQVGSKVKGTVISVKEYGIFIEIMKGVEGLVHISEISWTDRITDLQKQYKIGQEVEAVIVSFERKNRRMSLSIKQIEKNPWERITEEYKIGQVVKGKITNIADFGFFVQIAPGIDGLVYVSDISWTQHVKHPGDLYAKGQELEVVIIDINQPKKKISLSVKELMENPWKTIASKVSVGDMIDGVVSKVTEFGSFVKLKGYEIEAFIHLSEYSDDYAKQNASGIELDKAYTFRVIRIAPDEHKIGLSLKKEDRNDKKYDKKTYYKENRESKNKDENSRNKDKKGFHKKDQTKAYVSYSNSEKKSSLQLEVERLMNENKGGKNE